MSSLKTRRDEIWLRFDPDSRVFSELLVNEVRVEVSIPAEIDGETMYRLGLLRDYANYKSAEPGDMEKLTRFLLTRPTSADFSAAIKTPAEAAPSSEPVTLRSIAYDAVRRELEKNGEGNLDDIVASIIAKGFPGLDSKRDSVKASVSSVLSALRNAFPEKIEKAWNKSVWRGKTTGRNPHVKVKKPFEMPDYIAMWESYDYYLKNRSKTSR